MKGGLLPLFAMLVTGCAATVRCPEPPGPGAPVFLLDHGRHASLVLPDPHGYLVRYAYGDRRWYADMDTGIGPGAAALFRRTPAVLGRRDLHVEPEPQQVVAALRIVVEAIHTLRVDADALDRLRTELELLFFEDFDAMRYNDAYDLEFVPHPRDYTGGNNSNHMVAEWLHELGCEVTGSPLVSNWNIQTN